MSILTDSKNTEHHRSDAIILAGLTLRQVRLVEAIASFGQMQRAATKLRISQPAASKLLHQVEATLGAKLFERQPRGLVPTIYGESFARHARAILTELGIAAFEISELRSGRGGRLAVGSVMAPAVETVAAAVGALRHEMPRLNISFEVETSDVLIARLLANQLDLIIARIPSNADPTLFEYEEIAHERAGLVVREGHPLARSRTLSLSATTNFAWVLQHRGSLLRRSVECLLLRNNALLPELIIESSSFLATMMLLSSIDAIAPLPLPVADLLTKKGRFRRLRLLEPLLVEPYGLIRVRGRPLSPTVLAFHKRLRSEFIQHASEEEDR